MKKFIFILVLCLFFINLASAGVVDVTNESYKKINNVPDKWKDIVITDKSTDARLYKIEDYNGNIRIVKHEFDNSVKVKIRMSKDILKTLPNYNGKEFAVLHIAADGTTDYRIIKTNDVSDKSGNVIIDAEMSETIIGGATGYWIKSFSQSLFDTTMNVHGEGLTAVTVNITSPPTYGKVFDYVPGINDTAPVAGAVAWWRMDEASGTTLYDDIGSNDMTIVGSPLRQSTMFNKSLKFGHTVNDYASCEPLPELNTTKNFTICAWINASDTANTTTTKKILASGMNTRNRITFVIKNGYLVAGVWDGSSYLYRQQIDIDDNTEYFVSAVYRWTGSSGTFDLYANDLTDASSTVSIASDFGGTVIKSPDTNEDNVIIFNRALSTEEVQNVRRGFSGIRAYTYPGGNMTPINSASKTLTSTSALNSVKFNSSYSTSYSGSITEYFQQDYTLVNEYNNATHHKVDMIYTPQSNVSVGHINFTLDNPIGLGSPILTTNESGATVTMNGGAVDITFTTLTEDTSKYFNVALPILPKNIISYTPESSTINLSHGQNQNFTVTIDNSTDIEWLLNGTVVDTDSNTTSGAYELFNGTVGSHNVTARVFGDQKTWIVNIIPVDVFPFTMMSYLPATSPTLASGVTANFNASVNKTASWVWKKNNVVVKSGTGLQSYYLFNATNAGIYNILATATNGTSSVNHTWTPTVAVSITSYDPAEISNTITAGSSITLNATANGKSTWVWKQNGTTIAAATGSSSSVLWTNATTGSYNLTAIATNGSTSAQHSWTMTVTPLLISSHSPTVPIYLHVSDSQLFSATANYPSTWIWKDNGTTVAIDTLKLTSAQSLSGLTAGAHNITAIAVNGLARAQYSWTINVYEVPQNVTDPTIMITSWSDSIGEFYIQNAITSNITFSLKNAIVNNYYYLKYENGTNIIHELATTNLLNITASNLPDGKYYITNSHPTILITNNSEYNKTITLTNVSAHTLTFALNDVNIGNYYYFRYANNTAITYVFAEASALNLTVSHLPDGTYYITNSNPRLLITNYDATNKILNVSNMSDHMVTLNLTNVTNGSKYTLYNNANAYITSGYAQDDFAILIAQNLYDGIYHINTEVVGDTILVNKDNLLTKQLNVSYNPGYNGQLVHLVYNVNESYVFIDLKSTSSLANITSNATHLIITDTVSDVSETVYYNVTAIRKSTITTDAIYITTTIIIGGVLVLTFRKRRAGR